MQQSTLFSETRVKHAHIHSHMDPLPLPHTQKAMKHNLTQSIKLHLPNCGFEFLAVINVFLVFFLLLNHHREIWLLNHHQKPATYYHGELWLFKHHQNPATHHYNCSIPTKYLQHIIIMVNSDYSFTTPKLQHIIITVNYDCSIATKNLQHIIIMVNLTVKSPKTCNTSLSWWIMTVQTPSNTCNTSL